MILHGKRKRPATILSEDSVTKIAVGTVWEKIRQALEKILQAELGYLEGATLSGAERKKDYVQPAVYTIDGFCSAHLVRKAHFYALLRKGEGQKLSPQGNDVTSTARRRLSGSVAMKLSPLRSRPGEPSRDDAAAGRPL
jgi:hypothetical protein